MPEALLEREAAVAEIDRLLADAAAGKGRALFLVGEAGLGKTSLLALARRKAEGFKTAIGRGSATEATLPFGILGQALAPLGAVELGSHKGARSGMDARATAFHSALTRLRNSGPILLTLDDLHWADTDSLALLTFLCRRTADWPVVIIGAIRANPPAAITAIRRAEAEGDALIETLQPLSPRAAAELFGARAGRSVDDETAQRAWEASSGNPLLLEHLAARFMAQGTLRAVGPEGESRGFGLLVSRFAGVSAGAYEFARMASVLGTSFRPSEAAELSGFGQRESALALEELARAGIVRSESNRSAEFVHPLLGQLMYEEIPEPARIQYHAMAFRILATSGAALNEAAVHARLAALSGDPQAIAVLEGAGRLAFAAGAFAQAREHYQAAVDTAGDQASAKLLLALGQAALVGGEPASALTAYRRILALPGLPPDASVAARRLLGRALMVMGRHDQAEAELALAEEIALRIDPSLAVEVLLDHAGGRWQSSGIGRLSELLLRARELARDASPPLRQRAEVVWSFVAFHQGDPSGLPAMKAAARAAESDPVQDLGDLAWSWGALGMWMLVARFTEQFAESNRAFDISYRAAREAGMPSAQATLAISQIDQLIRLGQLQEAADLVARTVELAEVVPLAAPWLAVARGYLDFELGNTDAAVAACDHAEKLGAMYKGRLPIFWLWLGHTRGRLLLDTGRAAEAATVYDQVEKLASRSGVTEPCVVPWIGSAIEAHVVAGRDAEARRLVEELDRVAGPMPCRRPRAESAIGRARLAERDGDLDHAEEGFREALSLLEKMPMPLTLAEAMITYGRFLRLHHHPREARPYFAHALELSEESGATRVVRLARAEMRAAGGRRHRASASLTPQEARVAQLAAEGLSDKQISRKLSISARTVDAHLQHVYSKLGIRSRRELMRRLPAIEAIPEAESDTKTAPLVAG